MAKVKIPQVTDRERIAEAFAELVGRGYITIPSWSVCCNNCGWAAVARAVGAEDRDESPEGLKTVWWHEQGDSYAFCLDPGAMPQTEEFLADLDDDDDDESWFEDHMEEAEADSILARLTEYTMLLAPLFLHWRGDRHEIAAALRVQGLRVQIPDDDSKCIVILPTHVKFQVQPVNGEVFLEMDDEEILLSAEDAKTLARKLTRAAKVAEMQMPVL